MGLSSTLGISVLVAVIAAVVVILRRSRTAKPSSVRRARPTALNYVEQAFSPLGLTLNVAKCKWWCGQAGVAPTGLPATVQRAGVLPVLGSSLPYVVASELEHLDLLDADAPLA